jgi:hypothetical protein
MVHLPSLKKPNGMKIYDATFFDSPLRDLQGLGNRM